MNLLELMLKEKIEWPVRALWAMAYDDEMAINFCFEAPTKGEPGYRYGIDQVVSPSSKIIINTPVYDLSNTTTTREEYQAAGGWMVIDKESAPPSFAIEIGKDGRCYRAINQKPVQLDNPEVESDFEPLVSIEDAQEYNANHAATAKQAAPKGSGNPILGMVLADLTNRALEGKEKYGEPLKANNCRNALWDAYQEALDLAMYLRQAIEEQECQKN